MQNERTGPFDYSLAQNQQNEIANNRLLKLLSVGAISIGLGVVYQSATIEPVRTPPNAEQLRKVELDSKTGSIIQLEIDRKEENRLKAAIEEAKKKASYEYNPPTDN